MGIDSKPAALPPGYPESLEGIKTRIRAARLKAALTASGELILLYWAIGKDIRERQGRQGWGAKVIDRLSLDLRREMPNTRGFSPRNLKYMRAFAKAYPAKPFVQQVVAQLPWGHHIRILDRIRDSRTREWYVRGAVEHGWSRDVLVHQIESRLHERQGNALTNFSQTLPSKQSGLANEIIKDPYSFDFLQIGADLDEQTLEGALIDKMQKFPQRCQHGCAASFRNPARSSTD